MFTTGQAQEEAPTSIDGSIKGLLPVNGNTLTNHKFKD